MEKQHRTNWFYRAKWGVFIHFLCGNNALSAVEWNRRVDDFDTHSLARQLKSIGAGYLIITIGQGSGHYCAPNNTYDALTGLLPSKCSNRDLIADLYEALVPEGIRLMVYTPSEGPFYDHEAREGLKMIHHWSDKDHDESNWARYRQVDFMRNWEKVLGEWSMRWGDKISGWWVDGCYFKEERFPEDEEPNLKTFAEALKSGNPETIIAFNPGVKVPVIAYSDYEDYTAGEICSAFPVFDKYHDNVNRWVDGAQYHILSFLGNGWSIGSPRFPNEFVIGFTKYTNERKGVVSWDVPISEDNGLIPEVFCKQLLSLKTALDSKEL